MSEGLRDATITVDGLEIVFKQDMYICLDRYGVIIRLHFIYVVNHFIRVVQFINVNVLVKTIQLNAIILDFRTPS